MYIYIYTPGVWFYTTQMGHWDFPGGPVVKNPSYNAEHVGSIQTKISHAPGVGRHLSQTDTCISSIQSLSPVWLFDLMDCSTPGFPVHHQLPELTQTHAHWVRDAIQPSHPLSSPSPPTFSLSQHQDLSQWVSSSHQVTKVLGVSALASVLPMNIQDWFPSGCTGWISLLSKGLSRVFSNTTVQKHQFFST